MILTAIGASAAALAAFALAARYLPLTNQLLAVIAAFYPVFVPAAPAALVLFAVSGIWSRFPLVPPTAVHDDDRTFPWYPVRAAVTRARPHSHVLGHCDLGVDRTDLRFRSSRAGSRSRGSYVDLAGVYSASRRRSRSSSLLYK